MWLDMLKSIALGLMVLTGSLSNGETESKTVEPVVVVDVVSMNEVVNSDTVQLDVFFMYGNENGTYWLEPSAEYENVVWIGYEDLKEWNIEFKSLHHGNKLIGTFDNEGWELFGLEYIK